MNWYSPLQEAAADGNLARISECLKSEDLADEITYSLGLSADPATAQFLIDAGADVDFRNPSSGLTTLGQSINCSSQEVSIFLIDKGVDVNLACYRRGQFDEGDPQEGQSTQNLIATPLMSAARLGRKQLVERLIAAGAKVNLQDENGETALSWASKKNSLPIAKLLIDAGADLDSPDNKQCPPIYAALSRDAPAVAALLLDSGASTDSLQWNNLLTSAARGDLVELSNSLASNRYSINQADAIGNTALHLAAMMNHAGAVKILLAANPDLSIENQKGHKPLHTAARFGNAECVFRLLSDGADVNEPSGLPKPGPGAKLLSRFGLGTERLTPLMLASQGNPDPQVSEVLIRAGADLHPNVQHSPLWVALGWRAPWGFHSEPNIEQVKLLIKSGADVHQTCLRVNVKVTMLMHAVESGCADCVAELLYAGANVHDRDRFGNTALHFLKHCEDESIVRLLVNAGADVNAETNIGMTPIMFSAESPNPMVMALLLELGADPHVVTENGFTALGKSYEHPKQIQLLLDAGVDPDVPDQDGDTPILRVTMFGSYWGAQQLVHAGCDVNARNKKCESPLGYAVERANFHKAQLFLENGADRNYRNEAGESLIDIAEKIKSEKRKLKILDLLRRHK